MIYRCNVLDREALKAVSREIEISWLLAASPYIVRFIGFTVNPPDIYITMELCCKGSLWDVLARHTLTYTQRLGMACEAAGAVAHVHLCGFVHRDIKSLNFFVTDETKLRLGDFGALTAVNLNLHPQLSAPTLHCV